MFGDLHDSVALTGGRSPICHHHPSQEHCLRGCFRAEDCTSIPINDKVPSSSRRMGCRQSGSNKETNFDFSHPIANEIYEQSALRSEQQG